MDKVKSGIHYVFSSYKRTAAVMFFAALFLAIPVTISFLGNNQDIRQRASAVCGNVPADIMLVIDKSQSMSGSALTNAKTAAKSFVDIVAQNSSNRIGVVSYSSNNQTSLDSSLTNSFASVKTKIDLINASGETCTQCGIKKANEEISSGKRTGVKNVVILLTDGRANAVLNGTTFPPTATPTPHSNPNTSPSPITTTTPIASASPTVQVIPTGNGFICQAYATQLQALQSANVCTTNPTSCQTIRNIMTNAGCTLGAQTSNVLGIFSGYTGEDAAAQAALAEVSAGNSQNQTVYFTIGLGNNVSTEFLQKIATATGGKYFYAPNASDLTSIYQQISQIVGKGSVAGAAYNDLNSNGTFDTGEPGIPGLTFTLTPSGGTQVTATTDATGGYSFTGLCDASYNLNEETNTNWTVTSPAGGTYAIALTNGAVITGKDFGNKPSSDNLSPTPTITPTASASGTLLNMTLTLPGIGISSSQSAQLGINGSPQHPTRSIEVAVYNSQNQLVATRSATANFTPATGVYNATINLGDDFTTGNYLIKARMDNTLWRTAPGITTITNDQSNTVPTITLIPGDFDKNNQIDILDYNKFISCNGSKTCDSKVMADFNDDGKVEELDLNILLNGFARRNGD